MKLEASDMSHDTQLKFLDSTNFDTRSLLGSNKYLSIQ